MEGIAGRWGIRGTQAAAERGKHGGARGRGTSQHACQHSVAERQGAVRGSVAGQCLRKGQEGEASAERNSWLGGKLGGRSRKLQAGKNREQQGKGMERGRGG